MSLVVQTLAVEQGADWVESFTFSSPDPSGLNQWDQQVYYNFTGASVRMQVRQSADPTSTELLALATGGSGIVLQQLAAPDGPTVTANNTIQVTITAAQSLAITAGEYWYDMFVDWGSGGSGGSGTHTRMMSGNFQVITTYSR